MNSFGSEGRLPKPFFLYLKLDAEPNHEDRCNVMSGILLLLRQIDSKCCCSALFDPI